MTQITGINNAGDLAGFYTDANRLVHSFFAAPSVPEPCYFVPTGIGMAGLLFMRFRRRRAQPEV